MKPITGLISAIALSFAFAGTAQAGAAPEDAMATLLKRGYTSVEILPGDAPGYEARACKGGTHFDITLDRETNIIDVDPTGQCGGSRDYVEAPPPPPAEPHGYKGEYYGAAPRGPVIAREPFFDRLRAQGYYNIRVKDRDDDEVELLACKDGWLYEIEIKYSGRIDDIDKEGRCKGRRYSKGYDNHVDAPFTSVRTGKGRAHVEAPFTDVRVGRREVHIRAPFVDLRIPRW